MTERRDLVWWQVRKWKETPAIPKENSLWFVLSQYLISQHSLPLTQILCYESDTSSFFSKCSKLLVCISKYQKMVSTDGNTLKEWVG